MNANTLFLRLEGPMQAWGNNESKFVIRRTADAPTKSGVTGMLLAALGISRSEAPERWLPELRNLQMGVRIDRPGIRWWDYHTVGAGIEMRTAKGKTRAGALLTRREYLCDASFLVALQGKSDIIFALEKGLKNPVWTLYFGRKCCPLGRPINEYPPAEFPDIVSALTSVPWRKRLENDEPPDRVGCLIEWQPTLSQPEAPPEAEVWYDVPLTLDPPSHAPRFVIRGGFTSGPDGQVSIESKPLMNRATRPLRPRADYTNSQYKKIREERLSDKHDHHLCVFCKSPATTVQHITYEHAGGDENVEELRSLCRLCHDAVTMIEYGHGMGLTRINPEDPKWREEIIRRRQEIIDFRSLETRRRKLDTEDVE